LKVFRNFSFDFFEGAMCKIVHPSAPGADKMMMVIFVAAEEIIELPVGMDDLEYYPSCRKLFQVPVYRGEPDRRKAFLELPPDLFRTEIYPFARQYIENGKPFWGCLEVDRS